MDVSLSGRRLIVTGGTGGVGGAIAELAAASGAAAILVTGRDRAKGAAAAEALSRTGCEARFVAADLADPAAPGEIFGAAVAAFGGADGLVNAAGDTARASVRTATMSDWDRLFAVDARAPFFLMQAAVADMERRGAGGAIVNILSMNAHCGTPDLAVYAAAKGALATLTRNAANALLPRRIRVNGINMGWAATPAEHVMQAETLAGGEGWEARAAAGLPLKRLLTAAEVARLAVFLLSDASGLMTGALIDLEQWVVGAPPALAPSA